MVLTKEMAEEAKAMIPSFCIGVCWAVLVASDNKIDLSEKPVAFWEGSDFPDGAFKWRTSDYGKRRVFIDSLIGKDL